MAFIRYPVAMDFQATIDELKVQAADLVEMVKGLIHEGNVRRIIIRDEKGNTFMEIPISVAAVGAVVAPLLAALGKLAPPVARFTVVVERTGANDKPGPGTGDAPVLHSPKLRNADLPSGQEFEQHRLEFLVHLVDLVNQQHARPLTEQCAKQRTLHEEVKGMKTVPNALPIGADALGLGAEEQLLECRIEFANGLFLRDARVALQPLDDGVSGAGNGNGEFGLAASRRPLNDQRLLHLRSHVNHLKHHRIDDVLRGNEPPGQLTDGREHGPIVGPFTVCAAVEEPSEVQ